MSRANAEARQRRQKELQPSQASKRPRPPRASIEDCAFPVKASSLPDQGVAGAGVHGASNGVGADGGLQVPGTEMMVVGRAGEICDPRLHNACIPSIGISNTTAVEVM